ncbi:membrane hypothetical protein [metagenome]|uniref:Methylamine utilisation protein MauE domain-containing protein n=1 Tax=metagenome TaxID=256318 RepID=A0A2P2C6D1_9ZZZZ
MAEGLPPYDSGMSSAPTASLLVLLTLGAVLAASAVAKVRNPLAFADGFVSLRVPSIVPRQAAIRVMPWAEGALAALLLLSPSAPLVVVGGLVVMIMAIYTWLIGRALTFGEAVDCACFGALGGHTVSWLTLARNLLLLALSGVAVWIGLSGGSAPDAVRDLHGGDWWTLAAALAAVVVAATIVGGRADAGSLSAGEPELDYERRPIPYGVLTTSDGTTTTLAELASTQARLLVVLNRTAVRACAPPRSSRPGPRTWSRQSVSSPSTPSPGWTCLSRRSSRQSNRTTTSVESSPSVPRERCCSARTATSQAGR